MLHYYGYSNDTTTSHYVGSLALDLHEETLAPVESLIDANGRQTTEDSMKNHVIQVLSSRVTGSEYKANYPRL